MPNNQAYERLQTWELDDIEGAPHKSATIDTGHLPSGHEQIAQRRSKRSIIIAIITSLLLTTVLAFVVNPSLRPLVLSTGHDDGLDALLGRPHELEEGFTIVAPTYKRVERIPEFLKHYASGNITSLRRVILRWADTENDPPAELIDSLSKYPVSAIIERSPNRSLNDRFRLSENITTRAILSIDDDVLFKPRDIEFGYQVWNKLGESRRRLVGYHAREVSEDGKYMVDRMDTYSIILTKTAFFHYDWMTAYWSSDSAIVQGRSYVDEHRNCEDILMSFMFSYYTRQPPIYTEADFKDVASSGISTQSGHLQQRTNCVRKFRELFGNDTLISTDFLAKHY